MYSCPPHLQSFIRAVPVCLQTATVGEVWSIFCGENCDRLVVVNLEDRPLGVVCLPRLIGYLFGVGDSIVSPEIDQNTHRSDRSLGDRSANLIDPLIEISASGDWEEFWRYLQPTPTEESDRQTPTRPASETLVLVNSDRRLIGLLDRFKLLQFLAAHPRENWASGSPAPPSLLQLIEQLPIPVMVQGDDGIQAQNRAWRSQFGLDSQYLCETSDPVSEPAPPVSPSEWIYSRTPTCPPQAAGAGRKAAPRVSESLNVLPDWSEVETDRNTYVCVCSLPNRQERVWQFVRQPLEGNWTSAPLSGGSQLWLVIAQDITEQHRVAQELAAKNADLVQLNRLKDEFLACISHELKTPLTAVLGLSNLLKDQALGSLNERQARYAQLIHQSGRHLMMVVNDILDLTRMETGQLELIPEPVQIRSVCQRAFEMALQHQSQGDHSSKSSPDRSADAPNPQKRFVLEIEPGLESMVADELRLRQMLVNLLSNALKFTPDDGQIGLQVSRWENWIGFTVWDRGIGIPEDKQHLIFEKFQQLESPLTRKFEGTGLGLVLTQRLARLHGGDVSFISKHNQGSQFTLLLPPSPPQRKDWGLDTRDWQPSHPTSKGQRSPISAPRPSSEIQSRLVLIVEAVPRYIFDLSEQLTGLGYRVVIARSGTEALEKARCLQPRVIFLNPLLPLLSGWDVLTLLKTNTHTHEIPVVITATLGDKKRAQLNNCDGFLSLPVHKSDLQEILAELKQDSLANPIQRLTLLWLNPLEQDAELSVSFDGENSPPNAETVENSIHHSALILHHFSSCRILEADDLNQAELLARIWHPDAIILQSITCVKNPPAFLRELGRSEILANLPLVTLDQPTTELANRIESLSVFPCMAAEYLRDERPSSERSQGLESALLQVVQVAVGMNWKPNILLVDFSILPDFQDSQPAPERTDFDRHSLSGEVEPFSPVGDGSQPAETQTSGFKTKIDRALVQYLQTAGFRGLMAQSWSDVLQQVQYQSVDLLLICTADLSPALLRVLSSLKQISVDFPILILNRGNSAPTHSKPSPTSSDQSSQISPELSPSTAGETLQELMKKIEIKVLPGQISMSALLEEIKQVLHENPDR